MKIKELAHALHVTPEDYGSFRRVVKKLIDEGKLVRLKRGRIGPAEQMNIAVGTISINKAGRGFLMRENEPVDILILTEGLLTALDGDRVMVRMAGKRIGRDAGVVIKIVERPERNIVGVYQKRGGLAWVRPDNPRIHRDIYISTADSKRAKDGEKVVVRLTIWDDPHLNPQGEIIEKLGAPDKPGVDMLSIVLGYGFSKTFDAEIMDEAERSAASDTDGEAKKRLDLTSEIIYTIDPADAKDHDDAVSIKKTKEGYSLGVHIADVSFFVPENSKLDLEAFNRGNSVYLPGMVIPMIPEVLSNDVCSLRPDRKRLAHSVFMNFDKKGKMLDWKVADTVILSKARLSYEDVQQFFDTGESDQITPAVAESLTLARELAQRLTYRRFADGSLDFDLPESKIILDDKGIVIDLANRERLESHRLVEEFMLATNRAVALEISRHGLPLLYRVHDRPNMEKLGDFANMMRRLGHNFAVSKTVKPLEFARFLKSIKGLPESEFINELTLRTMQKAVYQRENLGHFGLAFKHYAHFTSPIRRYADLLIHRLLRKIKNGTYPVAYAKKVRGLIDNVGRHCSETERTAERAEREAIRTKQVQFMATRIGEEYKGVVSGVTTFGFFVRIENLGVEGLVRMSTLDDDYYYHDEKNYRIIGRRSGRTFRMGDAIEIGIASVKPELKEIDLYVLTPNKPKKKKKTDVKAHTKSKIFKSRKRRKR